VPGSSRLRQAIDDVNERVNVTFQRQAA